MKGRELAQQSIRASLVCIQVLPHSGGIFIINWIRTGNQSC